MNQPTSNYRDMVRAAASDLESRFRRGDISAKVWAVPTCPAILRSGALVVASAKPTHDARLVRPCANGASAIFDWVSVPYAAMESIIYHAARSEPIL